MKNYKIALYVSIILFLAFIVYLLVDTKSVKITSIAENQATQEAKGKEGLYSDPKDNSFSVHKNLGGGQADNPNVAEASVEKAKSYLLKQVGNRIKQLEPFKDKVEKMATLNESDRNSLVSELNAEIVTFEKLKPEITQSVSKEDIRNVADKVKAAWLKSRDSVKHAEGLAFASKENQLISDANATSAGMQKRIDDLKSEGKDTKPYEKLLSAYNQKIASAKQDVESAREKFTAASASEGDKKEKLMKENENLLTRAKDNIKDAYKLLGEEAKKDFDRKLK